MIQTVLVISVVVGLVSGLQYVSRLASLPHLGDENGSFLWFLPPAWFASPLAMAEGESPRWWLPILVTFASAALLVAAPPAKAGGRGRREPLLAVLLRPFRWLATKAWVRRDERAAFDLVYDALPRENEVVLRTYPMIGIPLAFLVAAALGPDEGSEAREGLFALLMFTAGIYLPVLLMQVPASNSAAARWIHECSPATDGAVATGAIKAVAMRFLLPLYIALGALAWIQAGPIFVLRVAVPGAICSLVVCQVLYQICVTDRPLSVLPDDLRADMDWLGVLGGLAIVLTLVSVVVQRFLEPTGVLLVTASLLVASTVLFRKMRTSYVVP